ncbi:nicotinate (nicotinamide) nucleotide adenylyltransferase [Candidatus Roizmanbacteria bacterium RIFCSPHIGHO2_12_FULL_41_11]|uniref:Probable nicotinate-nucleotide adenylyltransferase n=3 Tax=Candidatus Roizmaniibacteriota TaxID=1752723 RepID=A0A1F7JR91_9BACT|nr:MAG: nicotinate (nicotinamide) nucleotide adenylyltransferase [Candidatus Roizmanbacteria bacterium RIFCSPHIGHO2_12_FULL_41_11]OGK51025.1 MAG: nicotinate (nicotinamide) nucleotide adenylyltransferase [Candidatus Roizmanbacteria bacterium RIFCSPLOWO2_01_FULL_41_22]OGK58132.1 MAG: nicotinate (nicotinamide) nucleotide adenylyltransferase [Candidatus Roizmanbacteria bacterium RIFCSPLOWO2_02_FULL_41_9]
MKIGILGGAFDPPHLGHLIISRQVKDRLKLDEVWLMPCHWHPFGKKLSPTSHRLAMCRLVETDWLKVSDFEIKKDSISYTIDTLPGLYQRHPEHKFYWLVGSDQLPFFCKWKDWQKLVRDYCFIFFPRGTGIINLRLHVSETLQLPKLPGNISVVNQLDTVITNISSTIIRKRIDNKESIQYLVPDIIAKYFNKHQLYE